MRIAVLSAMSKPPHDEARPAFRKVGSADVITLQALMCCQLGCAKIVSLTAEVGTELDGLRQFCRDASVPLVVTASASDLRREVTADDEILIVEEGLLPSPNASQTVYAERPVIYARDAEDEQWQAMERIDAERRWAGTMLLPGRCAEELARLPEDVDIVSALLRIGLQRHVRIKPVLEEDAPHLFLTRTLGEMQIREHGERWLTALAHPSGFARPLHGLSERLALHFGTAHGTRASLRSSLGVALGSLGAALIALHLGYSSVALLSAALGSAAVAAHGVLGRLANAFALKSNGPAKTQLALRWSRDAVIALIIAFGSDELTLTTSGFLAAALILSLAVRPGRRAAKRTAFLRDRPLICLALALCAFAGELGTAAMILVVVILLDCVLQQRMAADNGALTTRG
ncbi:hypothetical protein [Qipengyuania atrilutea]|uniref:Uncharacterized protein n=1 Tax=Qipengyuania atrilutea TaxID=2744473 RepID=A0A850H456_9SPHN|nr:hypothetical protein [Actirhodobacter atriluteus]NVD43875.1 hypothetical protein [Actirhodobacter atriluteus]